MVWMGNGLGFCLSSVVNGGGFYFTALGFGRPPVIIMELALPACEERTPSARNEPFTRDMQFFETHHKA